MTAIKMLIEVDADTALEIEQECTKRGRSFSAFFLECYREKMAHDAESEISKAKALFEKEKEKALRGRKKS